MWLVLVALVRMPPVQTLELGREPQWCKLQLQLPLKAQSTSSARYLPRWEDGSSTYH